MAHITSLKLVMMFHLGCIWPEMLTSCVQVLLGVSLWVILTLLTLQLSEIMTLMRFIYFPICYNVLLASQAAKAMVMPNDT